jgi:hypothetical protein
VTKTEKAIIKAAYAWAGLRPVLIECKCKECAIVKAVLADKRAKKGAKK